VGLFYNAPEPTQGKLSEKSPCDSAGYNICTVPEQFFPSFSLTVDPLQPSMCQNYNTVVTLQHTMTDKKQVTISIYTH